MDYLFRRHLSFLLSIVEAVSDVLAIQQYNTASVWLASFSIFLLHSVWKVSNRTAVIESMAGAHIMYTKQTGRGHTITVARSSRILRARGKCIVRPRWYQSAESLTQNQQKGVESFLTHSPVWVISAAFTLNMKELPKCQTKKQKQTKTYSAGSMYISPLSSWLHFAVRKNSGGFLGSHSFHNFWWIKNSLVPIFYLWIKPACQTWQFPGHLLQSEHVLNKSLVSGWNMDKTVFSLTDMAMSKAIH